MPGWGMGHLDPRWLVMHMAHRSRKLIREGGCVLWKAHETCGGAACAEARQADSSPEVSPDSVRESEVNLRFVLFSVNDLQQKLCFLSKPDAKVMENAGILCDLSLL